MRVNLHNVPALLFAGSKYFDNTSIIFISLEYSMRLRTRAPAHKPRQILHFGTRNHGDVAILLRREFLNIENIARRRSSIFPFL